MALVVVGGATEESYASVTIRHALLPRDVDKAVDIEK